MPGRGCTAPGLLVHSDRGGQYLSTTVQGLLDVHGAVASTSRPGACLDNAVAESFFHTLKTELVYHQRYPTREAVRLAIFDYIAAFYNRTRRHSSVGYHSPEATKRCVRYPNPVSTFLGQHQTGPCAG